MRAGLAEAMRAATQEAKLVAGDSETSDRFGRSVSLSGDRALAGAYGGTDGGTDSGSAYVFDLTMTTAGEAAAEARVALSAPVLNPATQRAALMLALDAPQHVRAAIVDALGREVWVVYDAQASGTVRLDLDTAALAPGVYVVRVRGAAFAAAAPPDGRPLAPSGASGAPRRRFGTRSPVSSWSKPTDSPRCSASPPLSAPCSAASASRRSAGPHRCSGTV